VELEWIIFIYIYTWLNIANNSIRALQCICICSFSLIIAPSKLNLLCDIRMNYSVVIMNKQ